MLCVHPADKICKGKVFSKIPETETANTQQRRAMEKDKIQRK
jgi:hypothetical protein